VPGIEFETDGDHHRGMDHATHRTVPIRECTECKLLAYEPTWYAALMAFHLTVASATELAA
jgi:hypothetical protein